MDFIEQKVEKQMNQGSFLDKWMQNSVLKRALVSQERRWAILLENNFFMFFFPAKPTLQNSPN